MNISEGCGCFVLVGLSYNLQPCDMMGGCLILNGRKNWMEGLNDRIVLVLWLFRGCLVKYPPRVPSPTMPWIWQRLVPRRVNKPKQQVHFVCVCVCHEDV